jgi:hypothetical protein
MDEELSRAIVLYHSHPLGSHHHYAQAVVEAFGPDAAHVLIRRFDTIMAEAWEFGRHLSSRELESATDAVRAEVRRTHPELSDEAVKVIANYWRFCNR